MPQFVVKAADERGQVLQQTEQAESETELRDRLRQQGYLVYSVRPQQAMLADWRKRRQRIPQGTFLIFNQQFITLIKAGLPIPRALELLAKRARDPRLGRVLQSVRERVKAGELLSQAFREQPGIAAVYTTTLMAGERSGNLEEVLNRYVHYQRLAHSLKRKLASSLLYPALLMGLVVAILSFLVTFVVPRFGEMYTSMGTELPALTVFMLDVGNATKHYFFVFILALVGIALLIRSWLRGSGVGARIDTGILHLPLLGEVWWKYQIALLARTLSTLLIGGIPLVPALETSATALRSVGLRQGLRKSAQDVREGKPLSESLTTNRVVPEMASEMIEVGESTGALPQMLSSLADFYDEDLANAMTAILSLLEPAILVVVGTIVAFVLISLYLPLFTLYSNTNIH